MSQAYNILETTNSNDQLIETKLEQTALDLKRVLLDYEIHYLRHFWRQQIEKVGIDGLCFDDFSQTLYGQTGEYVEMFDQLLKMLVQNYAELIEYLKPVSADIEGRLKSGENVIALTNHITVASLPILLMLLYEASGKNEAFLKQAYTVVGPAVLVNSMERANITSFCNVIKTHPDTESGRVPEIISRQKLQARHLMKHYGAIFKEKTAGESGNLVLLAPSGTRDVLVDGAYLMKKPVDATWKLVNGWREDGWKKTVVLPVGSNESGVYGKRVLQQGRIELQVGEMIDSGQFNKQTFMSELAKLVLDKNGQQIAKSE